ncbi:hypothetical protein BHM03_00005884 [Ensete ventricosum]|nr:hypothetical protein BHM03_00005884 [Ensete ventricosum]
MIKSHIGLNGTCTRNSPSLVHNPHMLMMKAFIQCKIRCTHGIPVSAVPWHSLLESIDLLVVVLFTEVELLNCGIFFKSTCLCVLLPCAKVFRSQLRLRKLSRLRPSIKCFSKIRCMCLEAPFVFGTMQDESTLSD